MGGRKRGAREQFCMMDERWRGLQTVRCLLYLAHMLMHGVREGWWVGGRAEDRKWKATIGTRGKGRGEGEEMPSHAYLHRMLPPPLLVANEATRNIMQMSLNGALTLAPTEDQ